MDLIQLLQSQKAVYVIDREISHADYVHLDLSTENKEISENLVADSDAFSTYIETYIANGKARVAYGGYLEKRELYKRSDLFSDEGEDRDIHMGLDIWSEAGTPVLAALDAKVHSFDFNAGKGNYGPTIVLEHKLDNQIFYTLYGHLSVESIEDIEIGDIVKKGQQIATLGDAFVNGDYPPHLHFQVIVDMEGLFGDYPGVCSASDLDFYSKNCPDPNLLLQLQQQTS